MIKSKRSKAGDWIFVIICVLVSVVCLVPMLNLLARSVSSTDALIRREVYLLPRALTWMPTAWCWVIPLM